MAKFDDKIDLFDDRGYSMIEATKLHLTYQSKLSVH